MLGIPAGGKVSNIRELRNIATHCCLLSGNGLIDEAQTEELLSSAPARHPSPGNTISAQMRDKREALIRNLIFKMNMCLT